MKGRMSDEGGVDRLDTNSSKLSNLTLYSICSIVAETLLFGMQFKKNCVNG